MDRVIWRKPPEPVVLDAPWLDHIAAHHDTDAMDHAEARYRRKRAHHLIRTATRILPEAAASGSRYLPDLLAQCVTAATAELVEAEAWLSSHPVPASVAEQQEG